MFLTPMSLQEADIWEFSVSSLLLAYITVMVVEVLDSMISKDEQLSEIAQKRKVVTQVEKGGRVEGSG
jgi:hypothetical protein